MTVYMFDVLNQCTRVYNVREIITLSDGSLVVWVIGERESYIYPKPATMTIRLDSVYNG